MSNKVAKTTITRMPRRGLMFVLSSPSGAGKTTISRSIMERDANVHLSISVTTRPPRRGEVDGEHYHFISNEDFGLMVNRGELLEHAKVFDYYYGTPREQVERHLAAGEDVLFDIDWQGTQQLRQNTRDDLASVFILPPSTRDLERRLHTRAQDSAETIAKRMAKASDEISHWAEYDYVVINDDVERCIADVHGILQAERMKRHRGIGLVDFVKRLREGH
jgi:guanylate kinase